MDKQALTTFDYNLLDSPTRSTLREHAHKLERLAQNTAQNLWEMGHILSDAQDKLASYNGGTFVRWVEEEASLSRGTAYRMMDVYRAFKSSNLENGRFASSALYVLAKPSTPQAVRIEALSRAENGEAITHAEAQRMVQAHSPPRPALPVRPPLPPRPPLPDPDLQQFERDKLRPYLHDAGNPDAPQMLSGAQEPLVDVPQEHRQRAKATLRQAVIDAVYGTDTADIEALGECADRVLAELSQGNNSIAIASKIGAALALHPVTLSDLVAIAIQTCGEDASRIERDRYLSYRKRVLRLIDSISLGNGLAVYQHQLANGQICLALDDASCP